MKKHLVYELKDFAHKVQERYSKKITEQVISITKRLK